MHDPLLVDAIFLEPISLLRHPQAIVLTTRLHIPFPDRRPLRHTVGQPDITATSFNATPIPFLS